MLTADQLSAICAKYGACSHDALQEAARMGALQVIPALEKAISRADAWCDDARGVPCDELDEERVFVSRLKATTAEPHTPP
jgi:hypothetical protein